MKRKPFHRGKTFYALLRLLTVCIAVPVLLALVLTQRTLQRSHDALQTILSATLEAQMESSQASNPGRNHTEQLSALRAQPLLKTLGEAEALSYNEDIAQAEEILRGVTPASDFGQITTYLYFSNSNYLIDSTHPGVNAVGIADPSIFCGFDDLDTGYTGVPRAYLHGADAQNSENRTVYTATVFPNVIFIFDIYFPQYPVDSRPDLSVSADFTAGLKDVETCYYDSYGNARVITGSGELVAQYTYSTLGPDQNGYFTFRYHGNTYQCHSYFNEHNLTKYALFCRDEIAEEQGRTTLLIWATGILLLICFLLAAFLYTRRAYAPIDTLVRRVNRSDSSRNEFEVLSEAIDSFDDQLSRRDRVLGKYYLLRLMRGQSAEVLEDYRDEWFSQDERDYAYAVAALRVDEFREGLLYDESRLDRDVTDFFQARGRAVRTVADGDFLYAVFRLPRTVPDTDLLHDFLALQQQREDYYFSAYLSDIHTSPRELRRCYHEAMAVSEYYIANEKINIVANSASTPQTRLTGSTATPDFGRLRKLSDCVTALAVEDALVVYDDLVFQFAQAGGQPLHPESPLFDLLVNTAALAVYDIDVPSDVGRSAIPQYVSQLRGAENITQLRLYLQECLQALSRRLDEQEYYYQRFEKVRDYILAHYANPNLDASSIAEYYNMSPSTITRLFKKYNNTGFLEFVHQTRVEKATVLLQSTDLPIAEISAMVGYTNAATMNRAFKAHANSTPSMVRRRGQDRPPQTEE